MISKEILSTKANSKLPHELPKIEKNSHQHDRKKQNSVISPDINKLQEVIIDHRTKIYIGIDESPEEAKSRYFNRLEAKDKARFTPRKQAVSI